MKRSVRLLLGGGLILVVGAAATVGYLWTSMGKPLYEPGMVRAGTNLRAALTPPPQSDDRNFWIVEPDIRLYHFSEGQGRNALIVHGGPGYPYTRPWAGLAPLTTRYTFHYYDQRGCGQSTRPVDRLSSPNYYENMTMLDRTLGLGAQIADVERIRHILGDDRLILIGHSWGGLLASLYAAEFPEHVAALILVAPANALVMPQADGGLFDAIKNRLPAEMQAEYAAFLRDYLNFGSIFTRSEAELSAMNETVARYYRAAINTPGAEHGKTGGWMVQAMYLSMGTSHDYRAALKQVTAPVLVIHSADDFQTEQASRQYADAFPNATFRVIQNAAHFPFDEQPEAFAAVVGDFLNALK